MTCIAAAVNRETGEFVMGGDSCASTNEHQITTVMPKVFRNGEFIIGTAGSIRWQQMLMFLDFPRCPKGADLDRYIAIDFTTRLRRAARELGCLEEHEGVSYAEGFFLVAFRGRIWLIQPNFDAFETSDGIVAVGSGAPFALAAMKAISAYSQDLRTIVEGALVVAEYYSNSVRGPFTILEGNASIEVPVQRKRSVRQSHHRRAAPRKNRAARARRSPARPH